MDTELKITLCFFSQICILLGWIHYTYSFNILLSPTTFTEKERAAGGLNGHLVIWHVWRSLHNKITVQKLILTIKASSGLLSVTAKVGKEGFKYPWHVVWGQRGIESAGMPRSVGPRVCSSSADTSTVSGRCWWMRTSRSVCSVLHPPSAAAASTAGALGVSRGCLWRVLYGCALHEFV